MRKDKFTSKAKSEGYKARSVYKLKSINNKFRLIKEGTKVLDLGAWPGSWSQYCLELKADIDAVDLVKVKLEGINFIEANVFDENLLEKLKKYDIVLSDLAPKTTGVRKIDNEESFELSSRALEIAKEVLVKKGNFICKIFQSEFFDKFVKEVKKEFKIVKIVKPEASKKRSKEIYVVGIRKV
jgi:23S rRNA (uridine2552-2'-O)-methyltransferase